VTSGAHFQRGAQQQATDNTGSPTGLAKIGSHGVSLLIETQLPAGAVLIICFFWLDAIRRSDSGANGPPSRHRPIVLLLRSSLHPLRKPSLHRRVLLLASTPRLQHLKASSSLLYFHPLHCLAIVGRAQLVGETLYAPCTSISSWPIGPDTARAAVQAFPGSCICVWGMSISRALLGGLTPIRKHLVSLQNTTTGRPARAFVKGQDRQSWPMLSGCRPSSRRPAFT